MIAGRGNVVNDRPTVQAADVGVTLRVNGTARTRFAPHGPSVANVGYVHATWVVRHRRHSRDVNSGVEEENTSNSVRHKTCHNTQMIYGAVTNTI